MKNSSPQLEFQAISVQSSDPEYLNLLTPGHFIIGIDLNAITEPNSSSHKITLAERGKLTQQFFQNGNVGQCKGPFQCLTDYLDFMIKDLVLIKMKKGIFF
ncbi:hypothetical protein CEXT_596781 [Caerostris extrusa]|uniref:Uncharacterized protein n=1 Tax=Caerostris extrusa TaxID=172846 RepID=A0AAV4R1B0_CAEEX|nr:hypothetical protein CEXT_596781 [Caerostris extrusa]